MTLDLTKFDALTFDCYGTLIDWSAGILTALRRTLGERVNGVSDEQLLSLYGTLEAGAERPTPGGGHKAYRDVLREVVDGFGREFGFTPTPAQRDALPESIRDWPAFPDTREALRSLKKRYRLAVLSNIDRDLFALTAPKLGVELDALVTAQDVGSYKPGRAHFDEGLKRLGLPRERVLHVAQSLYHDIAPARALGLSTVWVARGAGKAGASFDGSPDARPDLVVADLETLVGEVEAMFAGPTN
ncbi:MAG: haloacid dehalogenase type II [Phycisphaeraceae bacterium]|nr:haloacid dehalogenase type II [Phycisphaeraceae bacterium]